MLSGWFDGKGKVSSLFWLWMGLLVKAKDDMDKVWRSIVEDLEKGWASVLGQSTRPRVSGSSLTRMVGLPSLSPSPNHTLF
jgi:hypothetical protein